MWQTGSISASSNSKTLVTMVVLLTRLCDIVCIAALGCCQRKREKPTPVAIITRVLSRGFGPRDPKVLEVNGMADDLRLDEI
jgi:hypothetical protein